MNAPLHAGTLSRAVAAAALAALLALAPAAFAQDKDSGKRSVPGPAGALYVDDAGGVDTLPVLFLHAFSGDSSHWASQLSHVRHHRRAIAMDLRGHGKSARPRDGDYSVAAMAKDVAAVVKALELKRFVLVGHSMGGAVAAEYAARNPSQVAGLVLVGAPGRIPPEQSKPILASLDANYDATMQGYRDKLLAGAQPHVRTQLTAEMAAMPREASIAIIRSLFEDDTLRDVDRYQGPKLIVFTDGSDSPYDLQRVRPQVPSRRISGTSHWPQLDRPGEFNELLDTFLAEVR